MGYFSSLSEHDSSRLLRSSTEGKGAGGDVGKQKYTACIPCCSNDVALGTAEYEKRRVFPNVTSGLRALGNSHSNNLFAPCHANHFSCRFAQDAACSWNTLAASLPSFHGVGWAEEQGKRSEMEDGTVVIRDFGGMPGAWLLAIYDGHGGRATVSLLLQRLHENLLQLLQERGARRWNSLKKQAQFRRSVIVDTLKAQQLLLAQLRCKPQWRQRRLCLGSQGETQFWPPEGKSILAEEHGDVQTPEHPMPGPSSKVEDDSVNQEIRERIDCYWQLIRTQQLLRVLRWMEEAGEDLNRNAHKDEPCLPPHYLVVCTEEDVRIAFSDAFRQTDEQLLQQGIVQSGATACVSLLRPFIDFERLVTMKPEEFTDHDWQLFCGSDIWFPLRLGRCDEKESADHDGRRCNAVVWSAPYSQASAAEGEGAPGVPARGRSSAAPLFSKTEEAHDFAQVDAAHILKKHGDIHCALPSNSPSAVGPTSVDASRCEGGSGTKKTRAISSLLSIKLSVAHLGDSRALLVALDGSCERLTAATDHKASSFQEVQRVEEAGGWVFGERVNGMLAIGRAFGDWCLKLNPEELKGFSAAALTGTGIKAERTGDCDEMMNGGERAAEPSTGGCKDSFDDKALHHIMRDGLGGFASNKLDTAVSTGTSDDEGGNGKSEESGETSEVKLSGGHPAADKASLRRRGRSVARHNLSSRQHALVVSNEPDICTKDLLAFQGPDFANASAVMTVVGGGDGVGSEEVAVRNDSQQIQDASHGSSVQRCGLTSPPVLLLLGCDGLFDVCSDHAVTAVALEFLRELREAHPDLTPSNAAEAVARALIEEAITFRGSTDNVSVTVALLLPMDFCGNEDGGER